MKNKKATLLQIQSSLFLLTYLSINIYFLIEL